jgi:hypothetical protein
MHILQHKIKNLPGFVFEMSKTQVTPVQCQLKVTVREQSVLIKARRQLFHWFILYSSTESEEMVKETSNWNQACTDALICTDPQLPSRSAVWKSYERQK